VAIVGRGHPGSRIKKASDKLEMVKAKANIARKRQ
jgi:hypothetical protein